MRTPGSSVFCGAIFCGWLLGSSAHAGNFAAADTKHPHPHVSYVWRVPVDYGKFEWPDSEGNVNHIVVSLSEQRLYAYDDQRQVAWSSISSGRPGFETPTGTFTVSEKDPDHHSNLFENAPMPYFMRLSDAGLGLHAGFNPGYPASHGCVRLPMGMARELFDHVNSGTSVEITPDSAKTAEAALERSQVHGKPAAAPPPASLISWTGGVGPW